MSCFSVEKKVAHCIQICYCYRIVNEQILLSFDQKFWKDRFLRKRGSFSMRFRKSDSIIVFEYFSVFSEEKGDYSLRENRNRSESVNGKMKEERNDGPRGGKKRKQRRNNGKKIGMAILVLVLVGILYSVANIAGIFAGSSDVKFQVNKGEGTSAISKRLDDQGIIRSHALFRLVSRMSGADREWDYGIHTIAAHSSYKDIINELTSPQTASIKVTLPEGKQVVQMATIFEEKGICKKKDFMKVCTEQSWDSREFLKGIPTKKRIDGLEGYLFPDTYYFDKNTDPEVVVNAMLDRFKEKVYTKKIRQKAKKMGFSIDEIVILASMAESEAVTKADRRTVSGVFLNRLKHGDKLQSCVTVEYAKRMKKTIISLADTQYDSPYNTYMYAGLPYGPICCPGMESINAVLYDEDNDYYYFQSDESGQLHFAKTYQEHVRIQKEVQKDWEVKETKIE